jgi:hypothetical protein
MVSGNSEHDMSAAQKILLKSLSLYGFDGYCDAMSTTGCKSYKSVDWVLDALERRGYIHYVNGDPEVTDAGRRALNG